jgi:hypothetical protein
VAIKTGELDAHSRTAARIVSGKREWIEKNLVHFHANLAVPKDRHYPSFAHLPELGSFAKSEKERKLLDVFRSFQYPRWPYIFPPRTPKERVGIIREAMRKSFADPEFSANGWKKSSTVLRFLWKKKRKRSFEHLLPQSQNVDCAA